MGNSSSHNHEPLERGFTRGKFGDVKNGKSASFRFSKKSPKKMDRLRRSFRDSFRRRKDRVPESSKPHQWQADEEAVRSATCSFAVKYLGCVEVFESRGMQVCEEALKVLRNSRRRPIRGLLHVSGDGLRVVDDDTKGLIVDQTIEKVSFCAPDRNHERGFSYICRDGTTRRWMCHGFLACKDSGERLSHAVGCAFAVCLERKQRRDKECGVTMTFDMKNSTFTRSGSFRQQTLTERIANNERGIDTGMTTPTSATVIAQQKPFNPFAIERPHATPSMLERQGSFRAFSTIGSQSPFKRQMSLRINDLPSNAERQKAFYTAVASSANAAALNLATPQQRNVSPIPEVSPHKAAIKTSSAADCDDPILNIATIAPSEMDTVSQLCKELSLGLSLLTTQTSNSIDDMNFNNTMSINQNIVAAEKQQQQIIATTTTISNGYCSTTTSSSSSTTVAAATAIISGIGGVTEAAAAAAVVSSSSSGVSTTTLTATSPPTAQISPRVAAVIPMVTASQQMPTTTASTAILSRVSPQRITGTGMPVPVEIVAPLPKADQWLGQIVKKTSPAALKRNPVLSSAGRTKSLSAAPTDPFDAEWVAGVTKPLSTEIHSTNPFISPPKPPAQSFQVQL